MDDLTEYKQTTTLNTKKHTQKTTMSLTMKDEDTTAQIGLTLNNQAKNSDKKIKLPKKAETISMEEFQEIVETAQENNSLVSEEDFTICWMRSEVMEVNCLKQKLSRSRRPMNLI